MVTGGLMVCPCSGIADVDGRCSADAMALQVDDQEQPMSYTQVFHLLPEAGSFYVFNDIFRLVYPAS